MPLHTDSQRARAIFAQGAEHPDTTRALDHLQAITETPEFQDLAADAARHFGDVATLRLPPVVGQAIADVAQEIGTAEIPLADLNNRVVDRVTALKDDGWDAFKPSDDFELNG